MKVLVPLAILASGSLFAADLALVEEIVAKCNGDIITRGDLDRSRKQLIEALRHEGLTGPAMEQTLQEQQKNLLRDRIDQLLLVQKGKDLNINVDSEVGKRLAQIQKDSGIADQGQISKLLNRLARLELIENLGEGHLVNRISVDERTRHHARVALDRMLSLR